MIVYFHLVPWTWSEYISPTLWYSLTCLYVVVIHVIVMYDLHFRYLEKHLATNSKLDFQ